MFRSQTDDGAGGGALYSIAFRGESRVADEDWRRLAALGTVEMIRAGITTLNDFWYAPDAMAEAALATGLRMEIATEIVDVDKTGLAAGDYTRRPEIGRADAAAGRRGGGTLAWRRRRSRHGAAGTARHRHLLGRAAARDRGRGAASRHRPALPLRAVAPGGRGDPGGAWRRTGRVAAGAWRA